MEIVKKKLWTAVFVSLAVAFVFNFIYQIVLLGYEAEHTFGFSQFHDAFGSLIFGAVLGIILNIAGIGVSIFAIFGVRKGKKFDNVMIGSLLFATIPLKSAINLLTIHSSFKKIAAIGGEFGGYYPKTGFLTITVIISFVSAAVCLLAAFLKKFKARHVLTAIALFVTVFFTMIYYPQMNAPYIYAGYGGYSFYMRPGQYILVIVGLMPAVVSAALYASLCSPKFEEKYRASAKARGIAIPNDQPSSNPKVDNREADIENAMKMYGMTREEAELLFPTENKVEVPTAQQRSEQLMKEAADRQNSNPSGSGAGLGMGYGLGLNVSQTQQSPSQSAKNTDQNALAELKREYLQGKITKEEFNKRLTELRK